MSRPMIRDWIESVPSYVSTISAGFQLVQAKLATMQAATTAMQLVCFRLAELQESGFADFRHTAVSDASAMDAALPASGARAAGQ